jgi:hypothetical protein
MRIIRVADQIYPYDVFTGCRSSLIIPMIFAQTNVPNPYQNIYYSELDDKKQACVDGVTCAQYWLLLILARQQFSHIHKQFMITLLRFPQQRLPKRPTHCPGRLSLYKVSFKSTATWVLIGQGGKGTPSTASAEV